MSLFVYIIQSLYYASYMYVKCNDADNKVITKPNQTKLSDLQSDYYIISLLFSEFPISIVIFLPTHCLIHQ